MPDLFFFITDNTPSDFCREAIGAVEFYSNRVRAQKAHERSIDWVNVLSVSLKAVFKAVDEEFDNRKIRFTGAA